MLENPVVPGVSAAAGHNSGRQDLMTISVVIVIAAVPGVVYFVRKRRNRSAPTNAEDGSDSWTRPPSGR
jgi:hypothetical protein